MSWALIGGGRLAMRTADTKAVREHIRPLLRMGLVPHLRLGALRRSPKGCEGGEVTYRLRIRLVRNTDNETVGAAHQRKSVRSPLAASPLAPEVALA